ncbi:putative nucleotidyltransferase [Luteibacter sp. Sphag1AF]|uniref:nucleotidyl transferase AbiEii/AbiGii toxin family protein n=1 Tax=Luteibacter sp. Sphag1AF TaxID=2587031 RepID=UPI001614ABEC|nr:nucleotidyl transferase AbiEii/AbiGii toxin family protein [Luteibacter sp. Sphag1AF]MBB3226632.1 putative nucleotidyltransferase [Luteibacter sp. Sphag1AF]
MAIPLRDGAPFPKAFTDVLSAAKEAATDLDIRVTIVGATARDIVLSHIHGVDIYRATADVDIALAVADWSAFNAMLERLEQLPHVRKVEQTPNRLWFSYEAGSYPLDLLPFGDSLGSPYLWPQDTDKEMNVAGYADAAANALEVDLGRGLVMNVASLPGLTLMKLFAWMDRRKQHSYKDATDLGLLLRTYVEAGHSTSIYESEPELMDAVDWNLDRASPRLLGRHTAMICSDTSFRQISQFLGDDASLRELSLRMFDRDIVVMQTQDAALDSLTEFYAGFSEARR